jgi:hypothetical protein
MAILAKHTLKFAALAAFVPAAVMLGAAPSDAAQVVVLEARGIQLTVGQSIDGLAPIKLEPGQKLALIAEDGKTIRLKGPFEGPPAPDTSTAGATVVQALLDLGKQGESSSATLGVVRGTEDRVAPDPTMMDVTRPGNRCVLEGTNPVLWWPGHSGGDAKIAIEPADHSWKAQTNWPGASGDYIALNQSSVPLRDGGSYLVNINAATTSITVHVVPSNVPATVRAAWMVDKGCTGQASAVAKTLASK